MNGRHTRNELEDGMAQMAVPSSMQQVKLASQITKCIVDMIGL